MKKNKIIYKIMICVVFLSMISTLSSCLVNFDNVESISFAKLPESVYNLGDDEIDASEFSISVKMKSGDSKTISLTDSSLNVVGLNGNKIDTRTDGKKTITVTYEGCTVSFEYEVKFIFEPTSGKTLEVGEGKTYSSLQAALEAYVPNTNDAIYIYNGTYTVATVINTKSNINIYGQSKTDTILTGGITIQGDSSNIKIRNISFTGTSSAFIIKASETTKISKLDIADCNFSTKGFVLGAIAYGEADDNRINYNKKALNNVSIRNCSVSNNNWKGFYLEMGSNLLFENIVFNNIGNTINEITSPSFANNFPCAIDLNFKYASYENVTIKNCVFDNIANKGIFGAAVSIKERGTGYDSGYASSPANISNVNVSNCIFLNCNKDIVLGEPGARNDISLENKVSISNLSNCEITNYLGENRVNVEVTTDVILANYKWNDKDFFKTYYTIIIRNGGKLTITNNTSGLILGDSANLIVENGGILNNNGKIIILTSGVLTNNGIFEAGEGSIIDNTGTVNGTNASAVVDGSQG